MDSALVSGPAAPMTISACAVLVTPTAAMVATRNFLYAFMLPSFGFSGLFDRFYFALADELLSAAAPYFSLGCFLIPAV
jgi:hypothetical protein